MHACIDVAIYAVQYRLTVAVSLSVLCSYKWTHAFLEPAERVVVARSMVDRFDIALRQIHCAHVACDSE